VTPVGVVLIVVVLIVVVLIVVTQMTPFRSSVTCQCRSGGSDSARILKTSGLRT
jgi:hypothetical protein